MLKLNPSTLEIGIGDGLRPVVSPWSNSDNAISLTREMDGQYIFLRGGRIGQSYFIDFVHLHNAGEIRRWTLTEEGVYVDQTLTTPLKSGQDDVHIVQDAAYIVQRLRPRYNDLNLHSILYFVYGEQAARDYMNALCPPDAPRQITEPRRPSFLYRKSANPPPAARKVHVCVIFNHNYARNIPILHNSLSEKFSHIDYLLPSVAPAHPNCYAYPVGSYQYHLFVSLHIDAMLKTRRCEPDDIILFAHDDVLIRDDINESNIDQVLGMTDGATLFSYYVDAPQTHSDGWPWNQRVNIAVNDNRAAVGGNGFEGSRLVISDDILKRGLGDVFVMKARAMVVFNYLLSQYCAGNVFPEVAIPTCIHATAKLLGGTISPFKLLDLWENRALVRDKSFIARFHKGDAHFLHPFKYNVDRT
jgi:hypothetical protein